jgi:hypothetical protein
LDCGSLLPLSRRQPAGPAPLKPHPHSRRRQRIHKITPPRRRSFPARFDTGLTPDLIKKIAARKPLRALFRDDGFGDDSTRINVEQIFKLVSPATEVKAL